MNMWRLQMPKVNARLVYLSSWLESSYMLSGMVVNERFIKCV
jgi:hypothetical protein